MYSVNHFMCWHHSLFHCFIWYLSIRMNVHSSSVKYGARVCAADHSPFMYALCRHECSHKSVNTDSTDLHLIKHRLQFTKPATGQTQRELQTLIQTQLLTRVKEIKEHVKYIFQKMVSIVVGSSYHTDVFRSVDVSGKYGVRPHYRSSLPRFLLPRW